MVRVLVCLGGMADFVHVHLRTLLRRLRYAVSTAHSLSSLLNRHRCYETGHRIIETVHAIKVQQTVWSPLIR